MKEFKDRVAVVTGGASGIGLALVKACLAEGMKVVIADVEEPVLDSVVAELGDQTLGFKTDVSKPESVEALADFVAGNDHTLLELAFSWLAAQSCTASVIAGATTPQQVRANAKAVNWKLSAAELAKIDAIAPAGAE